MSQLLSSQLPLLWYFFAAYALVVIFWLILENRNPQSTFAWLFLLLLIPVVGVVIYFFFGQGRHAFSKESELARQTLMGESPEEVGHYLQHEDAIIAQISKRKPASYKKKLMHLVKNSASSSLTTHNQLTLLQNASEKYPRLLADIEQAQQSIHMAYYIWEDDAFTNQLKELLIRKAQSGVKVRILCDAHGMAVSRRYLQEMYAGGVQMYVYYNYLSPFQWHTIGYRNHRKIVVIDDAIGYVGGLNMSQEHLDGGRYFPCWRDTHLRIEGEAAAVLQAIFITSWYNTTDEKLETKPFKTPSTTDSDVCLPVHITVSGPDSQWKAIRQLYFMMILSAEKHLYIQSPFFIPDDGIADALKAAALSGIDVRLMCAPQGGKYQIPYWAANTYFADLARAGVRIFLYQNCYFHPKTVNVDSVLCSIGTANMDIRSFSINYEVNAVVYDSATAQELRKDFLNDLKSCAEFSLTDYEDRNILLRLRDSIARLFSPLL